VGFLTGTIFTASFTPKVETRPKTTTASSMKEVKIETIPSIALTEPIILTDILGLTCGLAFTPL
jgi:hypothetical protein